MNVTPCFMLAIVDLAKIQHIALYHFAPGTPLALDDIPITMLFAVLEPSVASQKYMPTDSTKISGIGMPCPMS